MKILITGGCGFIGSNVAERYFKKGAEIIVLDNLSRKCTDLNLSWLKTLGKLDFIKGDIRDFETVSAIFRKNPDIDVVFHLAAQVAVTTSVINPVEDFEINIHGTVNLLESMRRSNSKAILIYASTNKVYGDLTGIKLTEKKSSYEFTKLKKGVSEDCQLDFHSPYGCSKGSADQYVRDYSRIYGLRTVVFRQSCIYGCHQFGMEDQGWVAHFAIQTFFNRPLTIYGNGKQVRDILFAGDLVNAYEAAVKNIKKCSGKIYNIGGGYKNCVSLLEFISIIEKRMGKKISYKFAGERPGDQKIYISDNTLLKKELNWEPKTGKEKGLDLMLTWIEANSGLLKDL